MSFSIEHADGSKRVVSGYKPSQPKLGATRYSGARMGQAQLPRKVDLRRYMTQVEAQGETSSCVANAVAGAYEYLMKRYMGQSSYDVSRLFIYYNARTVNADDEEDVTDDGSVISEAIDGLREYGACAEETWPFDEDNVNEEPDEDAYEEASRFLIEDTEVIPVDLNAWRKALAEGYPIIFGLALYDSFDAHRRPGLIPLPSPKESSRDSHSGHAMLCVGYSDDDQVFIVRNSWGDDWGDKGYCYIPYRYLMDARFNDGDSWIIRRLEELAPDEETWGEGSVIEALPGALAEMDEDAFAALRDAMGSVPLEVRIALLFASVAAVDELSDAEVDEISSFVGEILHAINSPSKPDKVLMRTANLVNQKGLLEESIALLGEHLPSSVLAGILQRLQQVVDADEASEEEQELVAMLVQAWQIEDNDEEGGEEDEDEESADDEDEDDEDDESEDEDEDEDEDDEDEEDEDEDDDEDSEDDEDEDDEEE